MFHFRRHTITVAAAVVLGAGGRREQCILTFTDGLAVEAEVDLQPIAGGGVACGVGEPAVDGHPDVAAEEPELLEHDAEGAEQRGGGSGAVVAGEERGGDGGDEARGARVAGVSLLAVAAEHEPLEAYEERRFTLPEVEGVHGGGEDVAPPPGRVAPPCGLPRWPVGRRGCGRARHR